MNSKEAKMTSKEISETVVFINTLGYYQCVEPVKEWFKWDQETALVNIRFVYDTIIKK